MTGMVFRVHVHKALCNKLRSRVEARMELQLCNLDGFDGYSRYSDRESGEWIEGDGGGTDN